MDSIELLAREDEFKKLNKQLEKKTESLMKEIEQTMNKQDIFSEFTTSLSSPIHTKKHNYDTIIPPSPITKKPQPCAKQKSKSHRTDAQCAKFENGTQTIESDCGKPMCVCFTEEDSNKEFLYAFVSVNVKEKVLPASFTKDRPKVESVCKFLASKVKLMQEQIDRLQGTLDKKSSHCECHLTQLAELESERMTLLNRANNLRASSIDVKTKYAAMQGKLNEKDKLYKEQRSETDRLTVELQRVKSKTISAEAKCATQQETIDNLKQQLEAAKRSEKEYRDSSRNLYSSHQTAISRLEAQIKTLTIRIERQMALIDNLRKQNVLLSTEGAVRELEKDYSDLLNQDL